MNVANPSSIRSSKDVFKIHGMLMWSSMGFLMPLAIIVVRFLRGLRKDGGATPWEASIIKRVAQAHIVLQIAAVVIAWVGGGMALVHLGPRPALLHTHGRLGLSLLSASFVNALLGLLRPKLKAKWKRGLWYFLHWMFETCIVILSMMEILLGTHVYEIVTKKSLRPLNIAFTFQIAIMSFIYLAHDRWSYFRHVQCTGFPASPRPVGDDSDKQIEISIPCGHTHHRRQLETVC
ncbi:hypothetical protein KP509_05G019600 [Ceratopteris richardii]|uniref:Cytochrome b561 domain-containing protein n=1 Tax=Ceratopteris richardii TaxID=49495 RepID=A0A8T2USQ6_CERRI|nr:hypothetical protein KP509_05G019600 [Ceratopteris richardii]